MCPLPNALEPADPVNTQCSQVFSMKYRFPGLSWLSGIRIRIENPVAHEDVVLGSECFVRPREPQLEVITGDTERSISTLMKRGCDDLLGVGSILDRFGPELGGQRSAVQFLYRLQVFWIVPVLRAVLIEQNGEMEHYGLLSSPL